MTTKVTTENLFPDLPPMSAPKIGPNTIYHIGVSGGKDSSALLLWMVRESGISPEKIRASFCDIGNDHEWTIEHVKYLNENVHPIETIRPERNFFELALDKKRFPSTKARFCTQHLKIYPTQDHIQQLRYAGFEPIAVSGVRADESEDRRYLPEWDYSGTLLCHSWRPLISWTISDVLEIHKRHGIPLNPLYSLGAQRVGCWPCIMSRKEEIRMIALMFPDRINEIRSAEQEFEKRYGRYSSFFPANHIPERFRTKPYKRKDGTWMMVCTIDDVVRWSMTGDQAQGSYLDSSQPTEPVTCSSGFCE